MTRPLDIIGELSLMSGSNIELSIKANGRIIELQVASLKDGYSLASELNGRQQLTQKLEQFQEVLAMSDLALHFRVAKRIVALLTPHSRPTLLSRLSGVAPVELKPLALLLVLLRL